jgi:DNA (cytosine-5)-methyltransferase 1
VRYGSVCSGIEAATVAWHPLGWEPAFFSEIEKFPRAVLQHHYPHVPLHGDFTTIKGDEYGPIDLLVGGTPCQSFSIAGLRKGLADARGNLALEYLRLVDRTNPKWIVWENVPGVLSSNKGRDFGSFLGALGELGYGFAYRVLDAQYFGVPQRRRRVFVVGYLGDWRPAAAVLFERESLCGNPPPCREKRKDVASTLSARTKGGGGLGTDFECDGRLIAGTIDAASGQSRGAGTNPGMLIASTGNVAHCLNAGGMGRQDYETETLIAHTLRGEGFDASEDGTGRGVPLVPIAYRTSGNSGAFETGDKTSALTTGTDQTSHVLASPAPAPAVRRLIPRECERLQGFPDDYTLIPKAKDGPRYKALGNSMAVPVMRWIGARISQIESIP